MGEMGEEAGPLESPGSPASHVIAEIEKPRLPLIGTDDTDLNWARDLNADQREMVVDQKNKANKTGAWGESCNSFRSWDEQGGLLL